MEAPFALMLLTLPLVQVGTVRGPIRFILPDVIALALSAVLLVRWRSTAGALARDPWVTAAAVAGVILCSTTIAASALSLVWITPANFQSWDGYRNTLLWLGTPFERTVLENLRLVQCVAALVATLVLADTRPRVRAAAWWYVTGATAAAAYGVYTWIVMVTDSPLPLLPGTFAYLHLKRTAATFPEPVAYGGFALTGLVLTWWLLDRHRPKRWLVAALALQLFAALTSLSTLVLVGLVVLWLAGIAMASPKTAGAVTLATAVAALVIFAAVPTAFITRAVNKSPKAASWLDRTTAWRTAAAMALTYPGLGVGAGLYAYNQAPFIPLDVPMTFGGGRINSIGLELAAESGAMGVLAGAVLFFAAWSGSARGGHGYAGLRGAVVLAILAAGYYTSRYAFVWVFTGLLIAAGTAQEQRAREEDEACVC